MAKCITDLLPAYYQAWLCSIKKHQIGAWVGWVPLRVLCEKTSWLFCSCSQHLDRGPTGKLLWEGWTESRVISMSDGIILENRPFSSAEERMLNSPSKCAHIPLPSKETPELRYLSGLQQTGEYKQPLNLWYCLWYVDNELLWHWQQPSSLLVDFGWGPHRDESLLLGPTVHFSTFRCYVFQMNLL